MKFSEVIGQQEVQQLLMHLVEEERLPHALMFNGPAGAGKMALALAFASYLLGEENEGKSLISSPSSVRNAEAMLKAWQHPDLIFAYPVIKPAGASSEYQASSDDYAKEWRTMLSHGPYFTMDAWLTAMGAANQQAIIGVGESTALIRKLSFKANQGGYKVAVIWMAERMNASCANALLKLIEEPPEGTVFLLVCEEPEKLLPTIRSRVQQIGVKAIAEEDITQALIHRRGITPDDARHVARLATGNWLRALEILNQDNENKLFLDNFIQLMRQAYKRDIRALKDWSLTMADYGRERQRRMLIYFGHMVRENFMYNFRQPDLNYMTQDEERFSRNFARFVNETNVIPLAELFDRAFRDIGQNANAKMVFFDVALQTIMLLIRK